MCLPVEGFASDAVDTLPLTAEQSERALQMAAAVPSPNPVPSPGLTARERRANYQNTVPAPSPSPAGPPSEPAPVEGETPGVAEVVGMVSNNTFVYINPMQCISYYVSSWCDLSI